MHSDLFKWLRLAIINLAIVALIGVILRYKIAYSLPFIDQKQLLHGHSHFAFSGWVSAALMALLVGYLQNSGLKNAFQKYKFILLANLVAAYGMLVAFPIQGYGAVSISFSTMAVVVSYWFAVRYWKDLNQLPNSHVTHLWFKGAVFFNAFSSLGTFYLAYMMISHRINQDFYLSAVYFFLHFQYNGWFFFACMGLFMQMISISTVSSEKLKTVFWYFFSASIPAYLLSTLWLPLPIWVFVVVFFAALAQVYGWGILCQIWYKNRVALTNKIAPSDRYLFILAGLALSIKLILQLGSTYPPLSQLAFGFRPIVIGYLHLVLLGVITIFILGYLKTHHILLANGLTKYGLVIFTGGIFLNELILMSQGLAALYTETLPGVAGGLLTAALVMATGIFLVVSGQFAKSNTVTN